MKSLSHEELLSRIPSSFNIKPLSELKSTKGVCEWVCSEGHIFKASVRNLARASRGCSVCNPIQNTLYSIDEVKSLSLEKGFIFLDDEYLGNKKHHNFQCVDCGYVSNKKFNGVISGVGCINCAGRLPATIEQVQEILSKNNRTLLSTFKTNREYVMVLCENQEVQHIYRTTPDHIKKGVGCPFCYGNYKKNTDDVNKQLEDIESLYRLISETYENNRKVYNFKCINCNHTIETTLNRVSRRKTCDVCSPQLPFGTFPDTPHTFYYLKIKHQDTTLYKIGITSRSIGERFSGQGDMDKITILREIRFDTGSKAYELEQYYLNIFKDYKYTGDKILKSGGNTELFITDILMLDKN